MEQSMGQPKKPAHTKLTRHVIPIRMTHDMYKKVRALAALSGHGTQSAVLRAAVLEGLRVLERRARQDARVA